MNTYFLKSYAKGSRNFMGNFPIVLNGAIDCFKGSYTISSSFVTEDCNCADMGYYSTTESLTCWKVIDHACGNEKYIRCYEPCDSNPIIPCNCEYFGYVSFNNPLSCYSPINIPCTNGDILECYIPCVCNCESFGYNTNYASLSCWNSVKAKCVNGNILNCYDDCTCVDCESQGYYSNHTSFVNWTSSNVNTGCENPSTLTCYSPCSCESFGYYTNHNTLTCYLGVEVACSDTTVLSCYKPCEYAVQFICLLENDSCHEGIGWVTVTLPDSTVIYNDCPTIPIVDLGSNVVVGSTIRVQYSNTLGPCPGGHSCDKAIFGVYLVNGENFVNMGTANLNNGIDGGDRGPFDFTITQSMIDSLNL